VPVTGLIVAAHERVSYETAKGSPIGTERCGIRPSDLRVVVCPDKLSQLGVANGRVELRPTVPGTSARRRHAFRWAAAAVRRNMGS